jgi:hypothetical protein
LRPRPDRVISRSNRRCEPHNAPEIRALGCRLSAPLFVRICRLDGTSDLFGPAPQSEFDVASVADRAFSASVAKQPAPDAMIDAYLAREVKFDPDVWILEVEDRDGRNFLDIVGER